MIGTPAFDELHHAGCTIDYSVDERDLREGLWPLVGTMDTLKTEGRLCRGQVKRFLETRWECADQSPCGKANSEGECPQGWLQVWLICIFATVSAERFSL